MRPRAAVFCLHDIVPSDRLDEVPVTHRPYALSPEEFRAHLMAVAPAARRTIPGPASTRYDSPLTTIASDGPERSGSALGVPVPSITMRVCAPSVDAVAMTASRVRSSTKPR